MMYQALTAYVVRTNSESLQTCKLLEIDAFRIIKVESGIYFVDLHKILKSQRYHQFARLF